MVAHRQPTGPASNAARLSTSGNVGFYVNSGAPGTSASAAV
jgi:hypothetical protein